MTDVTAIASKKAVKPPVTDFDGGEPHPIHVEPNVAMRRPYILESGSFYKRLEADLNYADNELEMIRINQAALAEREQDLMKVRNAALQALGSLQKDERDGVEGPSPRGSLA